MKKEKKKRLRKLRLRKEARENPMRENGRGSKRGNDAPIYEGKLTVTAGGFGFVKLKPGQVLESEDIFVPGKFMNDAMSGDEVKVALLPQRAIDRQEDRGPAGRVTEVLERNRNEFVGELLGHCRVRPLDHRLPEIEVARTLKGAKKGSYVRVKLTEHKPSTGWRGQVEEVMGKAGEISADLDAVVREYNLAPAYTEEENAAALETKPREIERLDAQNLRCVTIDPFDAKDFDDALSVEDSDQEGCVEIGVHISDVAAYIAPKSVFDAAAARRSFSCYLPGRTLPMLPKGLTAKISLQADKESYAHTVFLTVDEATGAITEFRRRHTKIRVRSRLNYEEVQEYIDHGTVKPEWGDELKRDLSRLIAVTKKMRQYRKKHEHFLEMELPEIRVLCDEANNKIQGLVSKVSRESEAIVEECMLAANSAVGVELEEKSIAGIYRVHPEPEPEKIQEFSEMLSNDFGILPGDLSERKNCNSFISKLDDGPKKAVILGLFLRSLPRAYYQEKSALHFGLGKTRYCHFTSPIRRYTDLTVHQQLWNFDQKQRLRSGAVMAQIAEDCSEKEENNDTAYFTANDKLKLRYLEELEAAGKAGDFTGVVLKAIPAGYQVDVRELGMFGFIPREEMPYETHYKVGDVVRLALAAIDFSRGSAEFRPKR